MSKKVTHWAQLLPDAGSVIDKEAIRIASLREKAAEDYKRSAQHVQEAYQQLELKVEEHWAVEDIIEAKKKYYAEHYSGELQSIPQHPDDARTWTFKLPDGGRTISIAPYDVAFVLALRKLPTVTKAEIAGISPEQCINFLLVAETELRQELLQLFSKKWYWRETADPVDTKDRRTMDDLLGIDETHTGLKRKIKAGKINYLVMQHIKYRLTGERSEIFFKD